MISHLEHQVLVGAALSGADRRGLRELQIRIRNRHGIDQHGNRIDHPSRPSGGCGPERLAEILPRLLDRLGIVPTENGGY